MSVFSIPTVFVVKPGSTLPSAGTPKNLAPGQLGVFLPNRTPANSGSAAAAKYLQIFQGRIEQDENLTAKRSDTIYPNKIIDFYKVSAEETVLPQITKLTNFTIKKGQQVTISLQIFSNYANKLFANGLTKSYTVTSPCLDCGDDACDTISGEDLTAVLTELVELINSDNVVSKFVSAEVAGDTIVITSKPIDKYGNHCDILDFPYNADKISFKTWAYEGSATWDAPGYLLENECNSIATVTITQNSTFPLGDSESVRQSEINNWSYSASNPGKQFFCDHAFNGAYTSYVVDGQFYDMYVIRYYKPEVDLAFLPAEPQEETAIIWYPAGQGSAFETILEACFGTIEDKSAKDITSTTTTTTSSTTTTTTTGA